jgi:hypothetical protein
VWDGGHNERGRESGDQEALSFALPTSNGRATQLLVVQEVSYDNPRLLHVLDCRWYGLEYNDGSKDEADGEEHRVSICENTFVRGTCTWDWLVCGCETKEGYITTNLENSGRQLYL